MRTPVVKSNYDPTDQRPKIPGNVYQESNLYEMSDVNLNIRLTPRQFQVRCSYYQPLHACQHLIPLQCGRTRKITRMILAAGGHTTLPLFIRLIDITNAIKQREQLPDRAFIFRPVFTLEDDTEMPFNLVVKSSRRPNQLNKAHRDMATVSSSEHRFMRDRA